MPHAAAPTQADAPATRRADLPIAGRMAALCHFERAARPAPAADAGATNTPLATARLILAAGALVRRYDWMRERLYDEQLVIEPGAVDVSRLERGAPLLNSHSSWSLEDVLGRLRNPLIQNGQLEADATFSRRESIAGYVQDVADEVIVDVSVGYVRRRVEMYPPTQDGGIWLYRVVEWEVLEGSLVPIPADADAQVIRGASDTAAAQRATAGAPSVEQRTYACDFVDMTPAAAIRSLPTVGQSAEPTPPKDPTMPGQTLGGNPTATTTPAAAQTDAQRADTNPVAAPGQTAAPIAPLATPAAADPGAAIIARAADIVELCQRHGLPQLAPELIRSGKTSAEAGLAVLDELARRDAGAGGHRNVSRVHTVQDETATRMAGMQEALMHRVHVGAELTDNGRQFRGMTLLEISRDFLEMRGINTRGMARMDVAREALQYRSVGMLGSSDFSSILANVANKRLRMGYEENPGSYSRWARKAPSAPDFKNISVVQLSAAPDLLQVNEAGEFKYASMTDGGETYSLITYGRVVSLTRQAIVNDDLRSFDRLVSGFGASAMRLENRLVYAILTANANMADGGALFNATATTTTGGHANLATSGASVLSATSLPTARTAMRLQKGLQAEELNIAPAFLIVPATLEQTSYQLTSPNYVPATKSEINEFRAGGRTALEPIVEPILDAASVTAWYLAARNSQIDTVEYCYLDGAEGPILDSALGFDVDGMSIKARLDFAAKAIDWRGLYKSAGA